jgi:thioredoxin-related protein
MRKFTAVPAVLFAMVALAPAQTGIQWRKDYEAGLKEAKSSGKLAMIDFYAEWWGWCKKLDKDTYPDSRVIQLSEQFVPIKLDGEKEGKEAAKKLGLHGFPTIFFVDGDGKIVSKQVGYSGPNEFSGMMSRVLELKHVPEWEAALKEDPASALLVAKLGAAYALKGDEKGAVSMAEKAYLLDPKNSGDKFTDLYNAVGDIFQNGDKPKEAIPYFTRAADTGKDPGKVTYALISMGYCYLMMDEPARALEMAKRGEALEGTTQPDKDMIASLRKSAERAMQPKPKKP